METQTQTSPHNGKTPPLAEAPQDVAPPSEPRPVYYSVEFLVEIDGYHVMIRGEQLTPADMLAWTQRTALALKERGVLPVRRDTTVNVQVAAPAAANAPAGGSGEATVIGDGSDGKPPRCSVHGPMRWIEGTFKAGHTRAGQRFEFWGCSERSCKLTFHPKTSS